MILLGEPGRIVSTKNAEELHRFANEIGLKREWYKKLNEDGSRGYYDIKSSRKLTLAIFNGVELLEEHPYFRTYWEHLTT